MDTNISGLDSGVTPHTKDTVTMFTCPAHDLPLRLDASRLLSVHSTSNGRMAYFRCVCDGVVIAALQSPGHVIGHAAGPGQRVGESPVQLQACA